MNQRPWRSVPPYRVTLLPSGRAAQRQVHFLGFVAVAGIVGGRPQDQKPAGDPLARQGSIIAEDFAPPVIIEEGKPKFLRRVGLAPGERRRGTSDGSHQVNPECCGVAGNLRQPSQHGQTGCRRRAGLGAARPVREKWSERRLLQRLQQLLDLRGDILGGRHTLLGRRRSIILKRRWSSGEGWGRPVFLYRKTR